jgi:P27 family predicted phage terminase small subunit
MPSRLTDEAHELLGTKPRVNPPAESQYRAGRPKCPVHFNDAMRAKFREVVRLFAARRVLTKADAPAIELYVSTYFRHRELLQELKEHGEVITIEANGSQKRILNPAAKAATACENSLRAILKEFGGTPLTREKSKPAKATPRAETFEVGTVGWILQQRGQKFIGDEPKPNVVDEEPEMED